MPPQKQFTWSLSEGTRTRDLLRDRQAFWFLRGLPVFPPDSSAPKMMSPKSRSLRLNGPRNYNKMGMLLGSPALKHFGVVPVVPNGHGMNPFAVIE